MKYVVMITYSPLRSKTVMIWVPFLEREKADQFIQTADKRFREFVKEKKLEISMYQYIANTIPKKPNITPQPPESFNGFDTIESFAGN